MPPFEKLGHVPDADLIISRDFDGTNTFITFRVETFVEITDETVANSMQKSIKAGKLEAAYSALVKHAGGKLGNKRGHAMIRAAFGMKDGGPPPPPAAKKAGRARAKGAKRPARSK